MRKRDDADLDVVETIEDEACTEFAFPRNVSWINAHTSVANNGRTKVQVTMSRHPCLRGPTNVYADCCFHSRRSRVWIETTTVAMKLWWTKTDMTEPAAKVATWVA
jgi:hypothetical protein